MIIPGYRKINSLYAFLLVIGWGFCSLAQNQSRPQGMPVEIHGQVRYAQWGRQADKVLVRLESFSGGLVAEVRTDRDGKFSFSNIDRATYKVTATAEGYHSGTQEVNLQISAKQYVLLTLVPEQPNTTKSKENGEFLIDAKVPKEAAQEFEEGRSALLKDPASEKGIAHLEKAIKIHPDYYAAHFLLGTSYLESHQLPKAKASLERASAINPKAPAALLELGEVYRQMESYSEARRFLQEGLKLDNFSWQGHFALGQVGWATGNIAMAGQEVGRTLQLKPDFAEADLLAGNILLRARKPHEAIRMFEEYLRLEPQGKFAGKTRETVEKIKNALASQSK